MQRKKQLIIGGLAVLLCLLGIGGYYMLEKQHLQERMMEEVKSAEVKREIETVIKNLDANAFTENGIIQSYEVDESTIRHNPMGGIMFTVYVNNDNELYINYSLQKDLVSEEIYSSIGYSAKLDEILDERN